MEIKVCACITILGTLLSKWGEVMANEPGLKDVYIRGSHYNEVRDVVEVFQKLEDETKLIEVTYKKTSKNGHTSTLPSRNNRGYS